MSPIFRFLFKEVVPPLVLAILVGFIWEIAVWLFQVPQFLLPTPTAILAAAARDAATLMIGLRYTAMAAGAGLLASCIVGGSVAILFSQNELLRRAGYPYAIFLQTVPIVAIAPLIVIWCGNGIFAVIVVSAVISLFPILAATTAGLIGVPRELVDVFHLARASRWQILLKLRIPHAVPFFLNGVRTSAGLAIIGSIVGEFFVGYSGSQAGLGYLILVAVPQMKIEELFAAVFAATLLGICTFTLIMWLERLVFSRWSTAGGERESAV